MKFLGTFNMAQVFVTTFDNIFSQTFPGVHRPNRPNRIMYIPATYLLPNMNTKGSVFDFLACNQPPMLYLLSVNLIINPAS